jgi:hypothetical protein
MIGDDNEQLDWAATMLVNITMFASDKSEMCNFKWIQLTLAHGSRVLAGKIEYQDDAAKRGKTGTRMKIVSNMRLS